jgi:hypothetical protein
VSTFVSSLPTLAAVVLATALPTQLLLAWIFIRLGAESNAGSQVLFQSFADLIVGSLTIPATYVALREAIERRSAPLLGRVGRAYRRAVGVWVGMALTRLVAQFVVSVTGLLPMLGGYLVVRHLAPGLAGVIEDPWAVIASASPRELALLAAVLPLGAGGVVTYLWYALAEPVVALERLDGFAALQRSKALTQGLRKRILAGMVLLGGPIVVGDSLLTGVGARHGVWLGAIVGSALLVAWVLPSSFLAHVFLARVEAVPLPSVEPPSSRAALQSKAGGRRQPAAEESRQ